MVSEHVRKPHFDCGNGFLTATRSSSSTYFRYVSSSTPSSRLKNPLPRTQKRVSGHTPNKKQVAVFDIDGTIFRSSLLIELVDGLIMEGVFPKSTVKDYERELARWLNREGSYDAYLLKVVKSFNAHLKGVPTRKLWEVARDVMHFHQKRVYRYTRDLVGKLKKTHFLIAISGSPVDIVGPFCREYGFDKVYGRVYEVDSKNRFTGRVLYRDLVENKAKLLKRAVLKEALTLRGSIGVGDSETDVAFLKLVERPIAFNPNTKLYRTAKRNDWTVVVERKDMTYIL